MEKYKCDRQSKERNKVTGQCRTRLLRPGCPVEVGEPPPVGQNPGVRRSRPSAHSLNVGSRGLHPAWSLGVPGHNLVNKNTVLGQYTIVEPLLEKSVKNSYWT